MGREGSKGPRGRSLYGGAGSGVANDRGEWWSFFQAMPQPVVILDPAHRVAGVNRFALGVLGKEESEVLGAKCYELFHGSDGPVPGCPMEQLLSGGSTGTVEMEVEALHRIFLVSCTPVYGKDGVITGIVHIGTDVTELRKARKALKESEEKYRIYFTHISDVVYSIDGNMEILHVSPSVEKMLGYRPEELIGKTISETPVLTPARAALTVSNIGRTLAGEDLPMTEYVFTAKDGTDRYGEVARSALRSDDGAIVGVISVVRDVTERKHAETALRESEKQYRDLFENATVGIFQSTPEGKFLNVNKACARTHGFPSPEEMMAEINDIGSQLYVDPAERIRYRQLLESGEPLRGFEVALYRRDRSTVWVSLDVRAIGDEKGDVVYYEGMITDITERKKAEEALRDKGEELKSKSASLEEANTALRVLLRHREEHAREAEDAILSNIRELIFPYLERLRKDHLKEGQTACLDMIEAGLNEIASPFLRKLTALYARFTPTEIRVANMVRSGKSTKEIAEFLCVGTGTVETHRKSIRNKLGLRSRKTNLQTYLRSLE